MPGRTPGATLVTGNEDTGSRTPTREDLPVGEKGAVEFWEAELLTTTHTPRRLRPAGIRLRGLSVLALIAALLGPVPSQARAAEPRHDVVTWTASAFRLGTGVPDRAYRLVVHTSVGGDRARLRLTNAFGDRPLTFDSVYAGVRRQGAELVPGSNRRLTFDGRPTVTIPPGEVVLSDPLPGRVRGRTDLVVSLHSPDAAGPATGHRLAMQTSYLTQGDHTADESGDAWTTTTASSFYLDAVTVRTSARTGAVVALGDSITDGWASTTDLNRRWPDQLADRLRRSPRTTVRGVANAGISANKVLADGGAPSALNRLDRDVLSHPGVRTVLVFEGVNDIKAPTGVTAADLIDGYQEIVDRVHAAGHCVVGVTIAPYKGRPEWNAKAEAVRQDVNAFIRAGGAFDAVADFDRAVRDPGDPERILPAYDNGDHLHFTDEGMRAMADAVDPEDLECARDGRR